MTLVKFPITAYSDDCFILVIKINNNKNKKYNNYNNNNNDK